MKPVRDAATLNESKRSDCIADSNRIARTARMRPDDKAVFVQAAGKSGLEPGIAARTLLEMMVK